MLGSRFQVRVEKRDDASARVVGRRLVVLGPCNLAHHDEQRRYVRAIVVVEERMPSIGITL